MQFVKLFLSIIFCLNTVAFSFGIGNSVDSLQLKLQSEKNSTKRFELLTAIATEIIYSDKEQAKIYLKEAEKIAGQEKDAKMRARVYLLKGRILETESNYNRALEYFIKAENLFEKAGDKRGVGQCLNSIGVIHWYSKNYEKAIRYFDEGYKVNEAIDNLEGMSTSRVNTAIIYDELGKYEEAMKMYEETLIIFEKLNDNWSVAACLNNMGLNLTSRKKYEEADKNYQKSLQINRELRDQAGIASCLNNIGYNLLQSGKFSEAIPYLMESLVISEKEGFLYDIKLSLLNLALSYNGLGDFKKAFEFHRKYSAVKDSILDSERQKSMEELETKYSTEKKNIEIKNLKKTQELEKLQQAEKDARNTAEQKTRNTILFSVIGIVLVTAGFFYWRFLQKKKDNLLLQSKNVEISKQKAIIEEKNKDITDSIQYAKTIQDSVLPDENELKKYFPDSFVLFLPRDIVSGDFYWFTSIDNKIIFTVGDCTGHGVPGSLMSMMGINLLHQIVREEKISDPSKILHELDKLLALRFAKENNNMQSKDGMDIAVGVIEKNKNIFSYASAMRPIYFVRPSETSGHSELMELKNDVFPIGGSYRDKVFKTRDVEIKNGDSVYFTTDGFADQFGGEKGKKFLTKKLKSFIQENSKSNMKTQQEKLLKEFLSWKGKHEQVDDVCILGVKI